MSSLHNKAAVTRAFNAAIDHAIVQGVSERPTVSLDIDASCLALTVLIQKKVSLTGFCHIAQEAHGSVVIDYLGALAREPSSRTGSKRY